MFELAPAIITDALNGLADQLKASQQRKGLRASGRSAASLRVSVATNDVTLTGQLFGADYWYYQQHGRGPGRYAKPSRALVEAIREWVRVKGLKLPAYAIAFKINRDGIKVPNRFNSGNVVSDILNSETVAKALLPRLTKMAFTDIKTAILKPL